MKKKPKALLTLLLYLRKSQIVIEAGPRRGGNHFRGGLPNDLVFHSKFRQTQGNSLPSFSVLSHFFFFFAVLSHTLSKAVQDTSPSEGTKHWQDDIANLSTYIIQ